MLRTILYNLAFVVFAIFYAPIFWMKLRQAEDPKALWNERRGIFPGDWAAKFTGKKTVWLHAVSVGEVMAIQRFLEGWLAAAPGYDIVLTTVTPTGQRIAKKFASPRVHVCYFPFDLTPVVKRFFDLLKPACVLLVETEIWPNLLLEAQRRKVPVGVINARLSERSLKRYRIFPWLFKPLWEKLDFVLTQSEEDAVRFRQLGIVQESVRDMGNMKFDQAEWIEESSNAAAELRTAWGYTAEDLVWIAGSTHPGEEEILMEVFKKLRERFPKLKLILAPRHIERSDGIFKKADQEGLNPVLSTRRKEGPAPAAQILDQLGVLKNLYQIADFVFMGGSLVPHGGQNPIEPARFSKAVLHGPHVFNFHKIYHQLDQNGGALRISAPDELSSAAAELLRDEGRRHEMGQKAFQIINHLRGASKRQAGWILTFLAGRHPEERNTSNGQHEELFSSFGGGQTK